LYLLFGVINSEKIIKNGHLPSCKNCVYYKPSILNGEFTSPYNKCLKFGEKNIITDEITYTYADACRRDENKCGELGIYFEKDRWIKLKLLRYKIVTNLPAILILVTIILSIRKGIL